MLINLFYDQIIDGQNCNGFPTGYKSDIEPLMNFESNLTDIGIQFNVITDKNYQVDNCQNLNLYVIELVKHKYAHPDYIFQNISTEFKRLMILKKLKLLFYFPDAGLDLDVQGNSADLQYWCNNLHQCAQEHGFGTVQKYLVTGDCLLPQNYQRFIHRNKILPQHQFAQVFGFSYNDYLYYSNLSKGYAGQCADQLEQIPMKTKNFLCYNYKLAMHRLMLISELHRFNLMQDSLVSWNMAATQNLFIKHLPADYYDMLREMHQDVNSEHSLMSAQDKEYFNALLDHLHHYVKNMKPIYLDWHENKHFTQPTGVAVHFNPQHYASTYFSLVTETGLCEGGSLHITEKIFKPLAHSHPLIVLGARHSLVQLRKLGYQTFPEFFDESYDDLAEGGARVKAVVEQVVAFCRLSKKEKDYKFALVKHKLEHNWHHFRNNTKTLFSKRLTEIFEQIHSD
jgi:hypothetical protein